MTRDVGASPSENPWTGLLQQGAALLQQLVASGKGQPFIHRDASRDRIIHLVIPAGAQATLGRSGAASQAAPHRPLTRSLTTAAALQMINPKNRS